MTHGVPAQKTYLFTDLRRILCSDLQWLDPAGQPLPLGPHNSPVTPIPVASQMPRGLRLVAQKATKTAPLPPSPWSCSRIIHDGGMYRGWGLRYDQDEPNIFHIYCTQSNDMFEWKLVHNCTLHTALKGTESLQAGRTDLHVFIDYRALPSERYKAVFCAEPPREQWPHLAEEYERVHRHHRIWRLDENFMFAMYGMVSPDGLEWTLLSDL